MPITQTAKKALRQSQRKRVVNLRVLHAFRSAIITFKKESTAEHLNTVYSTLDTAVKKGIIHSNKAARYKSRLAKYQAS